MKRLLDLFLASLVLIIGLPLFVLLAALIRIKLGAPVFFRQLRPGLHGQPFELIKFRTMSDGRDLQGELLPDERRITSLGLSLRRYSLDELPQFINVIKGDMSLVGPRPLLMEYLPLYTAEQARRHRVKPGITGWAQVNGRNAITWEDKFRLDTWYVDHQSLGLDVKILLLTVLNILRPRGVNQTGYATMSRFTGRHQSGKEHDAQS
jgi:sugar transferase EpsL